ncbi:TIR domain-containing protein [Lysinibacillus xylanilyticus]|uniref:TIR domain-containing protein n=1 Tax=Lysinibacillus xylanilyticus TaxID=582475 RepID=A0ABV3VYN7_9BACI
MSEIKVPHIFISYSWTSPEHEEWVLELATRLHADDGVEVTLDKWDLKDGYEIYAFMESMVRADENGEDIVDKVLMICDKGYQQKANNRKGGAGVEAQIVSPEIYQDIRQEKFVPIVVERDDDGNPYLPTYLKGRKYIDMSSVEVFEQGYEQLLRNLYQKPQHSKPKKGSPPAWLSEEQIPHFRTKNLAKQLQEAIDRNPRRVMGLCNQFKETFLEQLDEFQINMKEVNEEHTLDQLVYEKIHNLLPMRNDFIDFVELLCTNSEKLDIDFFIDFFEQLYQYTDAPRDWTSWDPHQFDHYKFLIHELFLYLITILIKKKRFEDLVLLLDRPYFFQTRNSSDLQQGSYIDFYQYTPTLEEIRKSRLKLNKLSVSADLLIQRVTKKYPKEAIVQSDMLLHYISKIKAGNDSYFSWFPKTYPYGTYTKIELLQRLVSKRHFEQVKQLFNVEKPNELKEIIIKDGEMRSRGYDGGYRIPNMKAHIAPEDICSMP